MQAILVVGILIFTGFLVGEIAAKLRFPKVTGYILAGVFLNPGLFGLMPQDLLAHTDIVTNIALCLITFSVGATLYYPKIKKLGRSIISITIFEAEIAFLAVTLGFLFVLPHFIAMPSGANLALFLPVSLLLGSLASPTDPSATLAVTHEYKAKGEVTSTILSVAAMDDVTGIMNFSIATVFAAALIQHQHFGLAASIIQPCLIIGGSIILGAVFAALFNIITSFIRRETEGALIVVIIALLCLCFGCATVLKVDELLATMTMGIVVVNFNAQRERIFKTLERYTEELVFVLFFTISGMQLNFGVLFKSLILVLFFVIFRTIGKVLGTFIGAHISHASLKVKKYAAWGLIPEGGIVVGLALIMKQDPAFSSVADIIISVIIGATVIHELIGPVLSKMALERAGEIRKG